MPEAAPAAAPSAAAPGSTPAAASSAAPSGAPAGSWWSSIDFGTDKDAANAAFGKFATPSDLLKATQSDGLGADWRKTIAGEDAKELEYLGRYASVGDYHKATREMRTKLSSGDFARPLPADATDAQKAEWRKANGLPEKPEDYFATLPQGLVIGEEDKPIFNALAKDLHGENVTPGQMHAIVKWYMGYQDQQSQAQAASDAQHHQAFETTMRKTWGQDFTANKNHLVAYLESLGTEAKEAMLNARLPDGMAVFNHPAIVGFLTDAARKLHAPGTIGGPGAEANVASVAEEIKKIENTMRTDRKAYNRDEGMQQRYRQLLEWRDTQEKRTKGTPGA